jgi:lipoate-protein ligase A
MKRSKAMSYPSAQRTIRELPLSVEPADRQLAGGPALLAALEETGQPVMRWYQVDRPALLLGSSQQPQVADRAACAAAGVLIHRRRSGGGAVLANATLLMLDLALPAIDPLYNHDVTESYRWLGEVWAAALRTLGLPARVLSIAEARADTQARDPLLAEVCFGGLSPYEVVLEGRKLVGLAQMRRRAGALFQAGVYLRWRPDQTAALLALEPPERARLVELLHARVGGLAGEGMPDTAAAVQQQVRRALERHAGLRPAPAAWHPSESAARAEALPRYAALA